MAGGTGARWPQRRGNALQVHPGGPNGLIQKPGWGGSGEVWTRVPEGSGEATSVVPTSSCTKLQHLAPVSSWQPLGTPPLHPHPHPITAPRANCENQRILPDFTTLKHLPLGNSCSITKERRLGESTTWTAKGERPLLHPTTPATSRPLLESLESRPRESALRVAPAALPPASCPRPAPPRYLRRPAARRGPQGSRAPLRRRASLCHLGRLAGRR